MNGHVYCYGVEQTPHHVCLNIRLKEKQSLSFLVLLSLSEETSEGVYKLTVLAGQRDQGNCDAPKIALHLNDNPVLFCEHHLGCKVCLHLFGIIPSAVDQSIHAAGETPYPAERRRPESRNRATTIYQLSAWK